jgi:hypothetical protein
MELPFRDSPLCANAAGWSSWLARATPAEVQAAEAFVRAATATWEQMLGVPPTREDVLFLERWQAQVSPAEEAARRAAMQVAHTAWVETLRAAWAAEGRLDPIASMTLARLASQSRNGSWLSEEPDDGIWFSQDDDGQWHQVDPDQRSDTPEQRESNAGEWIAALLSRPYGDITDIRFGYSESNNGAWHLRQASAGMKRAYVRRRQDQILHQLAERLESRWKLKGGVGQRVERAIQQRAANLGITPRDVRLRELKAALWHIIYEDSRRPQSVKAGKEWFGNAAGRRDDIIPAEDLPAAEGRRWVEARAYTEAEASLLSVSRKEYARLRSRAEAVRKARANASPSPAPSAAVEMVSLHMLVERGAPLVAKGAEPLLHLLDAEPSDALVKHLRPAPDLQRVLAVHLAAGESLADAAEAMGITLTYARQLKHRLKVRLQPVQDERLRLHTIRPITRAAATG